MDLRVKKIDDFVNRAAATRLHASLGVGQLTLLGVGAVIGTGIFVLSAVAAQKAGPSMLISFVIAGAVCALAALAYAEFAAMVPVSGSAYTYAYSTLGEAVAWLVGWALILEYAVSASAVAVGWSGYFVELCRSIGFHIPPGLAEGPPIDLRSIAVPLSKAGISIPQEFLAAQPSAGVFNLPAALLAIGVSALLIRGTRESARFTSVLVLIKVLALILFVVVAFSAFLPANFSPVRVDGRSGFMPFGMFGSTLGVSAAAASIFFAFVGFDAVSTAAEETKNPGRNVPIALLGSLAICVVFYLLIAASAIGAVGAAPEGGFAHARDPLAYVIETIGHPGMANAIRVAAGLALPSVVLMMIYGQTRIFFAMARDGLLPDRFASLHPRFRTPHVITALTGIFVAFFAGFFPVGQLADFSNSGTLFAFFVVTVGVMILRWRQPGRARPFRCPMLWLIGPAAAGGCIYLFCSLSGLTRFAFIIWMMAGLLGYVAYGIRRSKLASQLS